MAMAPGKTRRDPVTEGITQRRMPSVQETEEVTGGSALETKRGGSGNGGILANMLRRLRDPEDTKAACTVAALLLLLELLLCTAIFIKVPYTKIDWDAYMSQVEGYLAGERDYTRLQGDTGPLVYPAGFLYIFTVLRWMTDGQVPRAQVLFVLLYLLNQAMVFALYIRAKVVPPWALVLLCLSKRVHSIFILRLFNDCFAMAFLHASLLLMQSNKWFLAMLLFSAAVSVKMNVLLFAPPLLLLLVKALSLWGVALALLSAAALQVSLGAPFLLTHPMEYLSQAFNLGRVFIHHWSVNFKFVPEDVFVSKQFALGLLVLHLTILLLFAVFRWCQTEGGVLNVVISCLKRTFGSKNKSTAEQQGISASHILATMFIGNFIGIVCARSLHYQFYSWYFHSVPLMLWLTHLPTTIRLLLFFTIEYCWNVFPSTSASSIVLLIAHCTLLLALVFSRTPFPYPANQNVEKYQ